MPAHHQFDEFRLSRKLDFLNRLIHSILLVTFIIGVNLFALKFSARWDITPKLSNSLSPESIAHLEKMEAPIGIYLLMDDALQLPNGAIAEDDVTALLESYAHTSKRLGKDLISLQVVDPYRDRERLLQLKQRFEFDEGNLILIESGDHRRLLPIRDLYQSDGESGQLLFQGEQMLTGALLDVSDPVEKRVFFTVGHGEMAIRDVDPARGLSELATYARQRRIEIGTLDLSRYDRIPEWVDVLVIAAPQAEFDPVDVEKLRLYLEKTNGSLMVFLEPFRKHNLDELFHDWGVMLEDGVIMDPGPDYQTSSGSLILRRFAEHAITQPLIDNQLYVYSNRPRPVRMDPAGPRIAGVRRTALIGTSDTSWIEMDFRSESVPVFSNERDVRGPVPVGVVAERSGGESLGLKLKGGKLLVFGDASMLSNNLFRLYGNRVVMSNSLNWCLQRNHLLSIPPQRIANYRLTLSEADLQTLLFALFGFPVAFALVGLLVRVIRR